MTGSTPQPQAPRSKALIEAERWFARLRTEPCSATERLAFERWHSVPEHRAAYAETERLWLDIGGLAGNEELERMSADALAATAPAASGAGTVAPAERLHEASGGAGGVPRRRHTRHAWRWAAASAAAVIVVALSVAGIRTVRERLSPPIVHATGPGESSTVTLADGSRISLNVDTTVSVRMRRRARELTLVAGEALFEVEPGPQRPFRVHAGSGEVTALGTSFQVRKHEDQITVTVVEGRVSVNRRALDDRLELHPGQQAVFTGTRGDMIQRAVDPDVVTSWTRGRLLFRATPLAEVIAEVNRYTPTRLRLADPSLGDLPVSGTFPIDDPQSVALALEALLDIHADLDLPDEIVLSSRPASAEVRNPS